MNAELLLNEARRSVEGLLSDAEKMFSPMSYDQFYRRPAPGSWSAAECFAHLVSYNAHYNPAFRRAIEKAIATGKTSVENHHSTWIGRLCIKSVHPENIGKKMKTIARHNHIERKIDGDVVLRFIAYQKDLLELIEMARKINLQSTKVNIEIAKWLRLNLGDFFFFLIRHEERHMIQAKRAAGIIL